METLKVLISDDDPQIHSITKLVLDDYEFEGRPLELLHSFSREETKQVLLAHPDTALILLDIAMDQADDGLKIAEWIRQTWKNTRIRIVLRTGQVTDLPELDLFRRYDINDFKTKTELTYQKLISTLHTSLRTWSAIGQTERGIRHLQAMVGLGTQDLTPRDQQTFLDLLFLQIETLWGESLDCLFLRGDPPQIVQASGRFEPWQGQDLGSVGALSGLTEQLSVLPRNHGLQFLTTETGCFLFPEPVFSGEPGILYIEDSQDQGERDELLFLLGQYTMAYDQFRLMGYSRDLQDQTLFTHMGLLENPDDPQAYRRFQRVSRFMETLARCWDYPEDEVETLRLASLFYRLDLSTYSSPAPGSAPNPVAGAALLETFPPPLYRRAAVLARHHRENWDGTGFPQGLKGPEIPFEARMLRLADALDQVCQDSSGCSSAAWSDRIIDLRRQRGSQFDPQVFDVFWENQSLFNKISDEMELEWTQETVNDSKFPFSLP